MAKSVNKNNRGSTPSEALQGKRLPGGWLVKQHAPYEPLTGGCFSTGYLVEDSSGRQAFLKAMDYSSAFRGPLDTLSIRLENITKSINHERELLERCRNRRLTRVIRAIDFGQYRAPNSTDTDVVEYLIFELAKSDVRYQLDIVKNIEISWKLKVLHQVAVGLQQLHNTKIAHQDLKPSNILVVAHESTKIADLGRAACKGLYAPHDELSIPGDPAYATPESLYRAVPTEWNARRMGCDCYHLGSMVGYFFSGHSMTELLIGHMEEQFDPEIWEGTYEDVLPYLQEAFGRIIEALLPDIHRGIRPSIERILIELANPDYRRRGHPTNRRRLGNQYSLERYVSKFDLLYRRSLYEVS
ncbi:MAG: protein kinase [Rhodospirillaceae bacterium]|nr:protein kinase [Rhodospirillaceae bacterium]